jgi:hypothetical protein
MDEIAGGDLARIKLLSSSEVEQFFRCAEDVAIRGGSPH